jgi:hypothetical protein
VLLFFRIVLIGPHSGEIRELTAKEDGTTHESTAKSPTYYHTEASLMAVLGGLPGAAPAPAKPEMCAELS